MAGRLVNNSGAECSWQLRLEVGGAALRQAQGLEVGDKAE
jgi:hypothetical protein